MCWGSEIDVISGQGKAKIEDITETARDWDRIDFECDGWRAWECLGEEVLDWEGVIERSGVAQSNLNGWKSFFMIDLSVKSESCREIFERLVKSKGVIKAKWVRSSIIMDQFGSYR